ncbi:MAG TPA: AAA family ATPase [Candidatus Omnitrophica bacterium]|nr:MAG: AAA family ATPase [Omnitrophica WOR_2 bacterium GWA2_45_18]HBR15331.1 AAA family ATPase [Candidatus Omnitrophota bacterium]
MELKESLDFNEEFASAYDVLESTCEHVFVTGKAGTGKSTLLQYFRNNTRKNVVVLAPTGVAAVNVKGQTIHSFFRFKPDITLEGVSSIRLRKDLRNMYQRIDTIVIDEISMVRADLLDCMDAFLRLHSKGNNVPFGGVQMVFIGDLYQLPPVVTREEKNIFKEVYPTPYFFSAKSFQNLNIQFIELKKIYRQTEEQFIHLLSMIRDKTATHEHLRDLNKRYIPDFKPKEEDFYVYLTTTNALADQINQEKLREIKTPSYFSDGEIDGEFDLKNLPTQPRLELKEGAQVMLLNNDPNGAWVNGSIGKITYLDEDGLGAGVIEVELSDDRIVEVAPFTWEMFRFFYNEDTEKIECESVGAFTQYPLRLAWAITIHKSQGKTFSKVIIDIGYGTFSHGQMYVALSRCRTLDGIVLKKPILHKHILLDADVVAFMTRFRN